LKNQRYFVIIPASGSGLRFGAKTPKQYLPLLGIPILKRSIDVFLMDPSIEKIVVTLNKADQHWSSLGFEAHKKIATTSGGERRCDSVLAGLKKCKELGATADDWILVHDAVRPCLRPKDLHNLINKLKNHPVGGLLVTPVRDTLKEIKAEQIEATLSRENLYQAQTPQMFRYELLLNALEQALNIDLEVTDEAMAIEQLGLNPLGVEGGPTNIKITYPEDLMMAENFLKSSSDFRIGHGYDVHPFASSRKLILGGIEIPFDRGLLGHSDADAVLHALVDALLGALGLGDIGQHFSDQDPENSGRDSREFLSLVYRKVKAQGYRLKNADVTILAQVPKLSPYILSMRSAIADLCETELSQINIKATTTEGLGYIGREEGIAVEAVVLLTT